LVPLLSSKFSSLKIEYTFFTKAMNLDDVAPTLAISKFFPTVPELVEYNKVFRTTHKEGLT
jgi:hypothetical protein